MRSRRELVVACSDPVPLFDLVQEALTQISGRVKIRAEGALVLRLHLGGMWPKRRPRWRVR